MAEKEVDVERAKVPLASDSPNSVQKVIVQLKATADAPILKQNKFKILGTDKFAKVIEFLRRQLHRETVFVYINCAFSPNPDVLMIDLLNISSTIKGNIICEDTEEFSEEWEAGCAFRIQQAGRLRQLMNF